LSTLNLATKPQQLPPSLHSRTHIATTSYSKVLRGLRFPLEISGLCTRMVWFRGFQLGTADISLHPSCRPSFKRQGISLTSVTFKTFITKASAYFYTLPIFAYWVGLYLTLYEFWRIVSEDSRLLVTFLFIFEASLAILCNPFLSKCSFLFIK